MSRRTDGPSAGRGPARAVSLAVSALVAVPTAVAPTAPAAATTATTVAAGDFTPGSAGVGDPYFPLAGNGGYDVGHYDLRFSYDPATRRFDGVARIRATATQDLSAFDLDLLGLHVRSVTVDGAAAGVTRRGQELVVRPRTGLREGRRFRVVVRYAGTPRVITDADGSIEGFVPTRDGAFVIGEPVGSMSWFPSNNHPSDKATFTFRVTVPRGTTVLANGVLRSHRVHHRRETFRWEQREPISTYLATATLGRFDSRRSRTAAGLPTYLAVDPAVTGHPWRTLGRTAEITDWETSVFGRYPFSATGGVVDDARKVGYALETATKPMYDSAPDLPTVVHELAHQWYGDSVSPRTWREIWLNEGFATYAEWLWSERHGGPSAQRRFEEAYADHDADDEFWQVPPAEPGGAAEIFADGVYERGAMALQVLRARIGDRAFFRLLRVWADEHRYGTATTVEFVATAERVSGRPLAGLLRTWLYEKGKPGVQP